MIAVNRTTEKGCREWQDSFVKILPEIQQRLRLAFCRLDPEACDDSTAEAVVHSMLAYARLYDQGRTDAISPSSLAWYATLQVKRGRPATGRMNCKEPLSRYAQIGKGIRVEQRHSQWIDAMVDDKWASVVDQVAAKLDVGAWFATLSQRMKQIAKDLALGFSTSEVARKYGVTSGRISQLRRSLEESWAAFQQDVVPELG